MQNLKPIKYWKTILIAVSVNLFSLALFAQTITVRGKVVDETGEALIGATVKVRGTSTGATTNINGDFVLNVSPNARKIVISFLGYTEVEKSITGESSNLGTITLKPDTKSLEEVVVVGYGTQRKEAVTGSVASISGDALRDVPAANITQALQGRLPGVELSQTSTSPGATMQIRVRGTRSLSAENNPLVVLDGIPFPGNIGDLNPNDIKSIDVLKDASATAIYGSRGANGVILVTTNRGQRGVAPKISYNSYYGKQTIFAKYPMMNGDELLALRKAAGLYSTNGQDEAEGINTDWQDLFFKDGAVTDHNIGMNGGTETGSYNFGLGYYQNQGVIPTQQYQRFSLRGSLDQQVGKLFRVGFTTNNNYNMSQGNQVGVGNIIGLSPAANPYNADGTLRRTVRQTIDENYVVTRDVVESLKDRWLNENKVYATYNSLYGEVRIPWVEGLKYRVNLGLDLIQNNGGNYTGTGVNHINLLNSSSASTSTSQTNHYAVENLLTYDRIIAQKHNFNVVALYSAEQNKYIRSSMSAKDIPADAFQYYNLGQATGEKAIDPNGQDYQLSGLMSWMGRVMYSYDNRYMLSATLRSDASSRLAKGHQWHTYPAVSVGWNIANESFMKGLSQINLLKLRVGYGQTSNQSVGVYATLGRLTTRPYNFGPDSYAVGAFVSQLPNPALGWEYSATQNYALDFGLFNNRLTGTVEHYITDTKDILLGLGLPPTSGVSGFTTNIGETQNKGWEFSLNGTIIDRNGFTWDAGFNLYTNRNKLVALADGSPQDIGNGWFVGHNINAIYDYEYVGIWQEGEANLKVLEPGSGSGPGMIKVKYTGEYDANGVPTRAIGPSDRQIMDVDPDFQGGFNTRVAYKRFDLSTVASFRSGGILLSQLYGSGGYLNLEGGRGNNVKIDYWTPTNTGARYPSPSALRSGDNPKYQSTMGYFNSSFLKIRTITLGYDFTPLIKKSGVNLKMNLTAQNPFVMFSPYHKESGMAPETSSYGNENAAVALSSNLRRILTAGITTPSTRNYVIGLNLTF